MAPIELPDCSQGRTRLALFATIVAATLLALASIVPRYHKQPTPPSSSTPPPHAPRWFQAAPNYTCSTPLQITEVMFNPSREPTPQEHEWEYVEVFNPTEDTVDLAGYMLWDDDYLNILASRTTGNIPQGEIPPGGRVVLVNTVGVNEHHFAEAWGIPADRVVAWEGNYPTLTNSGENIYVYPSVEAAKAANGTALGACAALEGYPVRGVAGASIYLGCDGQWYSAASSHDAKTDPYGNLGFPGEDPVCISGSPPGGEQPEPTTPPADVCETRGTPIHEVQGYTHYSPLNGKVVTISGVVTGRLKDGFYLQTPDGYEDKLDATSEGIFVYTGAVPEVKVGTVVQARGSVKEHIPAYVSDTALPLTELVASGGSHYYATCPDLYPGARVEAVELSTAEGGRAPPTDHVYYPPNCTRVDLNEVCRLQSCPLLNATLNGLDFWESLEGMLVKIPKPVLSGFASWYGKLWVLGADGEDAGSLTQYGTARVGVDAAPGTCTLPGTPGILCRSDFNPEAIRLAVRAIDDNGKKWSIALAPITSVAEQAYVTGIVDYYYDSYQVNVVTNVTWTESNPFQSYSQVSASPTTVRMAGYNVENFSPEDASKAPDLGKQIALNLACPDLVAVTEIQDNDGTEGGYSSKVVAADKTFALLLDSIRAVDPKCVYEYSQIDPMLNKEGGAPGGNIRVGYLYNPNKLALVESEGPGYSDSDCEISSSGDLGVSFVRNPCRIGTHSSSFTYTRRPLFAHWMVLAQDSSTKQMIDTFFTVAVHSSSKGGSTPLYGAVQPYLNRGAEKRTEQHEMIASVVGQLRSEGANFVAALGDFNELSELPAMQVLDNRFCGELFDVVEEKIPEEERGTYVFDANTQDLDHVLVSDLNMVGTVELLRMNTPLPKSQQVSDHDAVLVEVIVGEATAASNPTVVV